MRPVRRYIHIFHDTHFFQITLQRSDFVADHLRGYKFLPRADIGTVVHQLVAREAQGDAGAHLITVVIHRPLRFQAAQTGIVQFFFQLVRQAFGLADFFRQQFFVGFACLCLLRFSLLSFRQLFRHQRLQFVFTQGFRRSGGLCRSSSRSGGSGSRGRGGCFLSLVFGGSQGFRHAFQFGNHCSGLFFAGVFVHRRFSQFFHLCLHFGGIAGFGQFFQKFFQFIHVRSRFFHQIVGQLGQNQGIAAGFARQRDRI